MNADKFKTLDQMVAKKNKAAVDKGDKPPMVRGSEIPPTPIIPSFSPALGYLLDTGGWPEGKLIEFYGQEHTGKTTSALLAAKDCYNYYNGERAILFVDLEHRFNPEWAEKLGVPLDDMFIMSPADGEEALQDMCKFIESGEISAVVYDSIGAATPGYLFENDYSKSTKPGGNAQLVARTVRTLVGLCDNKRTTCFMLNHVQDNMDWHGVKTPGGHAPKHLMSIRLYLVPGKAADRKSIKTAEGDFPVGFPIFFRLEKNSFGRAHREQMLWFYNQPSIHYDGIGYDIEHDYINIAKAVGVIIQAGPYYSWKDIKSLGLDKFIGDIRNTNRFEEFKDDVNSIIHK